MNAAQLQQWWAQRPPREKWLLQLALVLVAAACVWALALAPAIRTLRGFEASQLTLEAELQTMLQLQAQAQALQAMPRLTPAAASQALRESVQKAFDKNADFALNAGSASVTLRDVSAQALAQWLTSARAQAHSVPLQASLRNSPKGWSGTLQMALPTAP